MTKEIWVNLPVKNIEVAVAFFTAIGFSFNTNFGGDPKTAACMLVGSKNVVVMLFQEQLFESFTQKKLADTGVGSEVLFSIDAESKEEVDALAAKVTAAGGTVYSPPALVQGWMYGCGFIDMDGHRWNVLFMDMAAMNG